MTVTLTIQADDVGMSPSINEATRKAVLHGVIDAASVMVPCPCFDDIADFCKTAEHVDWGLHATLTCELPRRRWGPTARDTSVASLCGADGHFHASVGEFAQVASPVAVAVEIASQVEAARRRGVRLSYLDCHMYAVYARADLMATYIEAARVAGLSALVDSAVFGRSGLPTDLLTRHCIVIRRTVRYTRIDAPVAGRWGEGYRQQLFNMTGTHNQLLLHLGADDAESRALLGYRGAYGSTWRARDARYVHSTGFNRALRQLRIERRSWSSLGPNVPGPTRLPDFDGLAAG